MRPFSLLPAGHDAGIAQDLHVIGQTGLSQIHRFLQDAGAFLAAAQLLLNGKALRVTQCLEHLGVLLVCPHSLTSHQNILMYLVYAAKLRLSIPNPASQFNVYLILIVDKHIIYIVLLCKLQKPYIISKQGLHGAAVVIKTLFYHIRAALYI